MATIDPELPLQRGLLFALACLQVALCSGVAYGWTACQAVLQHNGYFANSTEDGAAEKFALVSTLGIAANALCKLPLGLILDAGGPRVTACLGGILLAVGALLLALGDRQSLLQVGSGYFLIGVAGPFVQMPCMQFASLYGEKRSVAISVLVTCFELSTGVFYVFKLLDDAEVATASELFLGYAGIGVLVTLTSFAFWPDGSQAAPKSPDAPIETPLLQQLRSGSFVYAACFMALHTFRQGFVLATVRPRVDAYFDADTASFLCDAFSVILPFGFLPMALCTATGLSGALLARPNLALIVVSALSMVYGLLLLVPSIPVYLAAFVIFPLARQLAFSTFFAYMIGTYGFATFGRLSGVASSLAGIMQLAQSPLITAIEAGDVHTLKARWHFTDVVLGLLPLALLVSPVLGAYENVQEDRQGELTDAPAHGTEEEDGERIADELAAPLIGARSIKRRQTSPALTGHIDPDSVSPQLSKPPARVRGQSNLSNLALARQKSGLPEGSSFADIYASSSGGLLGAQTSDVVTRRQTVFF